MRLQKKGHSFSASTAVDHDQRQRCQNVPRAAVETRRDVAMGRDPSHHLPSDPELLQPAYAPLCAAGAPTAHPPQSVSPCWRSSSTGWIPGVNQANVVSARSSISRLRCRLTSRRLVAGQTGRVVWVRSRLSARPRPIMPRPRIRCSQSSAVLTGTKFAAVFLSMSSPYSHRTR